MVAWFLIKHRCHLCSTQFYTPIVGMWWVAYICSVQAADSKQLIACMDLFACVYMHCILDTSWQRPGIVPPMVYLYLTQAVAWCENWFIFARLRHVLRRQRFLLSCPQHCINYWPPVLSTPLLLCGKCGFSVLRHLCDTIPLLFLCLLIGFLNSQ